MMILFKRLHPQNPTPGSTTSWLIALMILIGLGTAIPASASPRTDSELIPVKTGFATAPT